MNSQRCIEIFPKIARVGVRAHEISRDGGGGWGGCQNLTYIESLGKHKKQKGGRVSPVSKVMIM